MELIEKFEKNKRGIFSGAVGYISPEGDFDLNVVIGVLCIMPLRITCPSRRDRVLPGTVRQKKNGRNVYGKPQRSKKYWVKRYR